MRTRTLDQKEALALCDFDAFTEHHWFVINNTKTQFTRHPGYGFRPQVGADALLRPAVKLAIKLGAAIEVTESDVFDDPAFEKWDVSECRLKAFRGNFSVWSNGKCFFYAMLVNEVNPSGIPALAAAVNRLVEVGEVGE